MGDGCVNGVGLTVVDLDGTYIAGNSLHIYLRTAFVHHLRHGQFCRTARIAALLAMRAAHLISHVDMKRRALLAAGDGEALLRKFSARIEAIVRRDVQTFLKYRRACGDVILLATAAPDFYVGRVWPDSDFVATAFSGGLMAEECRGEAKLDAVRRFMIRRGLNRLNYVLTDSLDDAPLMKFNAATGGTNILVAPDSRSLRFFRELEPTQFLFIEQVADNAVTL